MNTLIVIPAYNEEANILEVVETISAYEYIVVNDGSSDKTASLCKEAGFKILDLPINLGLAAAIQAGMQYASRHGYDAVLQFDGDGQHNAQYIEKLCEAMQIENADIVIGSRFLIGKMPFSFRAMGTGLLRLLIRITTGCKISDPTSGMRLFNKRMIEEFAWNLNFGPEPDTLVYLMRHGTKVVEVPVTMNERVSGVSYLNFGNSIRYMLHMCVSILVVHWFRGKVGRQ